MLDIRQASGVCRLTGKKQLFEYDDVILDGQTIGICFRNSNRIHWFCSKHRIPTSIRKRAIKALMEIHEHEQRKRLRVR